MNFIAFAAVGVVGHEVVEGEAAEGPLVDEAQLAAAVGERDAGTEVRLVRGLRRLHEQLAAHAEVRDERRAPAVQREPEVLAATGRGLDRATDETKLHEIYKEIDSLEKSRLTSRSVSAYEERYMLFALLAMNGFFELLKIFSNDFSLSRDAIQCFLLFSTRVNVGIA